MVKLAPKKVEKKATGIDAFKENIKVDMETGRITSANILIAKVDLDKNDTEASVKEWVINENEELVEKAFKKYETACQRRRATLKQSSAKRKQIDIEERENILRQRVRERLLKNKAKKAK